MCVCVHFYADLTYQNAIHIHLKDISLYSICRRY